MSLHAPPPESTPLATMFSLHPKICLITGGNRGIGLAVATGFAEAGAAGLALVHSCAATAALAHQRAQELAASFPAVRVRVYQADVSVAAEIDAAVERAVEELGGLDVVVVNAGVYDDALALEVTPEVAQSIAGVNYLGALYTAQAGARAMKKVGKGGRIIFTASINGHMVLRPQREAIYCATKAAVLHLTRALAVEFAEHNIQVNSVSPGYIDTEMNDLLIKKNPGQAKVWLGDCPAGRFCKVWELKGVYVFLASMASSYVTGSDYKVDGGHTCH